MQNFPDSTLYELDNLPVLRGMNSGTVDLIATDPPFNTKWNRSGTAGFYEDRWKWGDTRTPPDQWKWNEVHPKWLEEIKDNEPALYQVIEAARVCHDEDIAAFLCFLSVRLLECRRILKPTGSIYLHCDHNANSYIRMSMDGIFGKNNFRNEIVWHYYNVASTSRKYFGRKHDTILFYSKGKKAVFNWDDMREPYSPNSNWVRSSVSYGDPRYGPNERGKLMHDVWKIPTINNMAKERTGSPDQKPLCLYKRIIKASSNEDYLVLDPFCGCATTIIAARDLNRRWVGIDRRLDAKYHVVCRMAGIDKEERERLERQPGFGDWVQGQMAQYEAHYSSEPPTRTDADDTAAPELAQVYPVSDEYQQTHEDMHGILIGQFGLYCWGCGFTAPDERYLELDHIEPRADGGSNYLDNRALLCSLCNRKKAHRMTLGELRRQNQRDNHFTREHLIRLAEAREWTRQYMQNLIRETPHQLNLEGR